MGKEYKINLETAEAEFNNFVEDMDLDIDVSSMDTEEKKEFEGIKSKIVKSIMIGSLVFNEKSEPVFTPQRSEEKAPLTFKEPTGAILLSMDKMKKNQDMGKMFQLMAEMTGTDQKTFSKLAMPDFKVCSGIVTLFLA